MFGSTVSQVPSLADWYASDAFTSNAAKNEPRGDYSYNPTLNSKVAIWKGDITRLSIDAIVNAANRSLLGGGGVDGAIHNAAGRGLYVECKGLGGCETGEAKITAGHKLPAKHVIHTVGPIGRHPQLLKNCYENCLRICSEQGLRTVAFCCISTGIYGYPNEDAAHVALSTTRDYLERHGDDFDQVIFCIFLPVDLGIYKRLAPGVYFPYKAVDGGKKEEGTPRKRARETREEDGDENREEKSVTEEKEVIRATKEKVDAKMVVEEDNRAKSEDAQEQKKRAGMEMDSETKPVSGKVDGVRGTGGWTVEKVKAKEEPQEHKKEGASADLKP
ncbi:O-acetyl-ADP-ribose deacetylase macrod1 [Irineochytrium annulatum]|nr:O-acetyl-ADP-ribose deacetylase macrod1 [Irineochytrium annulatum]